MSEIKFVPDMSDPFGVIGVDEKNLYFRARFPWGGFGEIVLLGPIGDEKAMSKGRQCVRMSYGGFA